VQLYLTNMDTSVERAKCSLEGFRRVLLSPGQMQTVSFTLAPKQLASINETNEWVLTPGVFKVNVGGKQPGSGSGTFADTSQVLTGRFEVTGTPMVFEEK
jgi:beta-glucosidase